ncbi:response regulator transcription factor [Evansella tamaricis]|uniref:Response regulator n=1 Tax=Evansella tamaricis TaxID=2069301 RepID=A0ABS6JD66_9BACI|nr:response regulator [Evansella tamaricis]MBU9711612.1 response regulator [Evansella tamaricis]
MIKMLIVDDEPMARTHVKNSFPWEDWGITIVGEATNGVEALSFCARVMPDVALIDITMPVMGGFQLLDELKRKYPMIKVIFLTAHRSFEFAQKAIHQGADGYILKSPINLDETKAVISKIKKEIQRVSKWKVQEEKRLLNYRFPLRQKYFLQLLNAATDSGAHQVGNSSEDQNGHGNQVGNLNEDGNLNGTRKNRIGNLNGDGKSTRHFTAKDSSGHGFGTSQEMLEEASSLGIQLRDGPYFVMMGILSDRLSTIKNDKVFGQDTQTSKENGNDSKKDLKNGSRSSIGNGRQDVEIIDGNDRSTSKQGFVDDNDFDGSTMEGLPHKDGKSRGHGEYAPDGNAGKKVALLAAENGKRGLDVGVKGSKSSTLFFPDQSLYALESQVYEWVTESMVAGAGVVCEVFPVSPGRFVMVVPGLVGGADGELVGAGLVPGDVSEVLRSIAAVVLQRVNLELSASGYGGYGFSVLCDDGVNAVSEFVAAYQRLEGFADYVYYCDGRVPLFVEGCRAFFERSEELAALEARFAKVVKGRSERQMDEWVQMVVDVAMEQKFHPAFLKGWFGELGARLSGVDVSAVGDDAGVGAGGAGLGAGAGLGTGAGGVLRNRSVPGVLEHDDVAGSVPFPVFENSVSLRDSLALLREWFALVCESDSQQVQVQVQVSSQVAEAISFIKENLREELTLNTIAEHVFLSPSYLGRTFKKQMGQSIIDYILDQRMAEAKRLMKESKYRNYEIAEQVGFQNYSYFSTIFKKLENMSPNEYRNSITRTVQR